MHARPDQGRVEEGAHEGIDGREGKGEERGGDLNEGEIKKEERREETEKVR